MYIVTKVFLLLTHGKILMNGLFIRPVLKKLMTKTVIIIICIITV